MRCIRTTVTRRLSDRKLEGQVKFAQKTHPPTNFGNPSAFFWQSLRLTRSSTLRLCCVAIAHLSVCYSAQFSKLYDQEYKEGVLLKGKMQQKESFLINMVLYVFNFLPSKRQKQSRLCECDIFKTMTTPSEGPTTTSSGGPSYGVLFFPLVH